MDLDDLKNSWKQLDDQEIGLNNASVEQYKNKHSKSPLVRLRKSMFLEMIIYIIAIAFTLLVYQMDMFNHSSFVATIAGVFMGLIGVYYGYFAFRIYKKSKYTNFSKTVSEQLAQSIQSLKKDVKQYTFFNYIMFIPAVGVGYIMGIKAIDSFESLFDIKDYQKVLGVMITLGVATPYYLFVKWWIQKFYGKYIEELEQMYKEITQEELE